MVALQYTANKFLNISDAAIRAQPSYLFSYAIPKSVFVLTAFATIGTCITLAWISISLGSISLGLTALGVLGGGFIVSTAAIHPAELQVLEKADCRPSEDAIGFLTFFVKLLLRCSSTIFAGAVIVGTCGLFIQSYTIFSTVDADLQLGALAAQYLLTATIVLFAIAIPFYAYLLTAIYFLSLDVLAAILSIPTKLDKLSEEGTQEGE